MSNASWAIVLCKFSDQPAETRPPQYYKDLFTSIPGGPVATYWRDVTHGVIDTTGSQVFGWFTMPHSTAELAGLVFPGQRSVLVQWGKDAAVANGVNLGAFGHFIVFMNYGVDSGEAGNGVVIHHENPALCEVAFICHEMGHAILDSLKPQLWGAGSHEAAAFHESFGDISSIISALQLQELRTAILSDTGGHLYQSSRLSRLAEQLGAAIRAQQPDAVEPDSLRNAVNRFSYEDPINLPPMGPASQLSSEPHSFSRVFTGAFYEALGGMLAAVASNPSAPSQEELHSVANDLASILVNAIKRAPVVSNLYAQVAATMVQIAGTVNSDYPAILKGVFVKRSILSLQSATAVELVRKSMAALGPSSGEEREPLARAALSGTQYGLDRPVLIETPSHARRFAVTAAAGNADPIEPASAITAAKAFLDDLFRGGHVDYGNFGRETRIEHGRRLRSYRLVAEDGSIRLERVLFDCGLCCR